MVTYNFKAFADTINDQFLELSKYDLYVTSTTKEDIYDTYLQAFPEGTNPIYKTRTEYDCSTCKQFIRAVGSVVAIIDGALVSVWDVVGLEYPYDVVAQAMAAYVKAQPIASTFCVKEASYGLLHNRELLDSGGVLTWHHFYAYIPSHYVSSSPGQVLGDTASSMQVMKRGLGELSLDAINTVLDLVDSNALYRGAEHKPALVGFKALKEGYDATPNKDTFLWGNLKDRAARFRNTVIGTLVQDLSEGVELERAVHSFETKMAGENYKRTKALVTPGMRNAALKDIQEMGLEPSLYRRHACIGDVSINDVLWVDGTARPLMKGTEGGGIAALLDTQVKGKAPTLDRATPIGIEEFMQTVLPSATSLEILLENRHLGNLMSITAPTDPEAPRIFKWGNGFGWGYKDNVADSTIKQKVKSAGGNVTAPLRVSLAWGNYDDLDIHVWEPGGDHIYFSNKRGRYGTLDVDMNAGGPSTRTPVENVCWNHPPEGTYKVQVHNFCKRESVDVGFTLEIESLGAISTYHYPLPVGNKEYVEALTIVVKGGQVTSITPGPKVQGGDSSKEEWGLKTQSLVKVDTVMLSPNYWTTATDHYSTGITGVGNKHWFFIIHGCLNPEPVRGIFNEQLRGELDRHRKVFEVLGDLTKVPYSDEQLSGLGYSSTRKDKVKVLVSKARAYEIEF